MGNIFSCGRSALSIGNSYDVAEAEKQLAINRWLANPSESPPLLSLSDFQMGVDMYRETQEPNKELLKPSHPKRRVIRPFVLNRKRYEPSKTTNGRRNEQQKDPRPDRWWRRPPKQMTETDRSPRDTSSKQKRRNRKVGPADKSGQQLTDRNVKRASADKRLAVHRTRRTPVLDKIQKKDTAVLKNDAAPARAPRRELRLERKPGSHKIDSDYYYHSHEASSPGTVCPHDGSGTGGTVYPHDGSGTGGTVYPHDGGVTGGTVYPHDGGVTGGTVYPHDGSITGGTVYPHDGRVTDSKSTEREHDVKLEETHTDCEKKTLPSPDETKDHNKEETSPQHEEPAMTDNSPAKE